MHTGWNDGCSPPSAEVQARVKVGLDIALWDLRAKVTAGMLTATNFAPNAAGF